jgi:hypothetical protein
MIDSAIRHNSICLAPKLIRFRAAFFKPFWETLPLEMEITAIFPVAGQKSSRYFDVYLQFFVVI